MYVERHAFLKQVAHRIDENHSRLAPPQWLSQLFRHQPQVEALLERMPLDAAEPLGKRLGIAVLAAGLIFVQPRTGFQVASVHSIFESRDIR